MRAIRNCLPSQITSPSIVTTTALAMVVNGTFRGELTVESGYYMHSLVARVYNAK